ncbi:30S ribosomal protein S20 [Thermoanaerobacterium sp. DL9XJH110]|uniref:30S ribosomal protein S20 n=1 Tax=Thermoanaerobacterium sp. DL9XJH110 TaxID=3386643 RepID=UPI003BB5CCD1
MPNIASAKKKARQAKKRTLRNNLVKSKMKSAIKKFGEALKTGDAENIKTAMVNAIKIIDKAASKGVIHKNAAARKKSSLYKRLSASNIAVS